MKHALSLSLCLSAALCAPAAQAQAPRTLDFAVQTTANEPSARALADFAREVESQTRGAVRVRLRFGVMNVAISALLNGPSPGALMLREDLEALCPTSAAFRVPLLFPDLASMDRIFETMRPRFESDCAQGVTVLGWSLPGPRHLFLQGPAEPNGEGQLPRVGLTETSLSQRSYFAAQPEVDPGAAYGRAVPVVPGVVVAPGERGLFANFNHVVMTPAGMDLGALVIRTATLNALTPEQQRAVREAAASTLRSITRTLRTTPLGNATRIPESPAWTAWANASRTRAQTNALFGPLISRMLLMLGPVAPPQTSHEVVPAPAPSAPRPSAPTTEPAPTTGPTPAPATETPPAQNPPAQNPPAQNPPAQNPPTVQPAARPGIDLPTSDLPAALLEAGYPRALMALRPRLLRCYEPALRAPTPLSGRITFELRLSTNGGVIGIRRLNAPEVTTISDPILSRCVESVLRGLRLPQIQSDPVTVQQAVVLRAP